MKALAAAACVAVVLLSMDPAVATGAAMCGSAPFSFTAPSGATKPAAKTQKLRATRLHGGGALPRPATGYALHSIALEESSDRACGLHATFMPLPKSTRLPEFAQGDLRLGKCSSGAHRTVSLNSTDVMVGARVCLSGAADKILGLQVFGATLSADGKTVTPVKYTGEALEGSRFATPECTEAGWQPEARCPAGQVAIGLRATHDGKGYLGLALECAPISPC